MPRRIPLMIVLLVAACSSEKSSSSPSPGGTLVISITRDPDVLFPPRAVTTEAREITEQIYEYLADVGVGLNTVSDTGFVKELADTWTWSPDSVSIAFHLRAGARWHDGHRVSAQDVRFTYALYTDTAVGSPMIDELEDIDSVSVRDSATAVFWFNRRTPRQFFAAASQMLIMPEHILAGVQSDSVRRELVNRNPVGTGRYRFQRWIRDSRVELRAVPHHYRGDALITRLIWTISPDFTAAVARLLGGEADLFEPLNRDAVRQLVDQNDFNVESLPAMDYAFLQFNLRDPARPAQPHPLFASRAVRRALTMGVDRRSIVRNLFDTLGAVSIGPMVRALPTTDTALAQIAYDPARAEALLDSLGWRRSGVQSVRTRAGRPLSFSILVPTSSMNRRRAGVMIQEQLRKVGVQVKLEELEGAAFGARQQNRDFDAMLSAWTLGSTPAAVRVTWTSRAARAGGLNYGAYANPRFDALVDSAMRSDVARARAYFRRANQIIIDDAPAIWLYEPRKILAIHNRIHTTPMRPNAWWLDIGHWTIPAERLLPRDRLPLTPD